MLNAKELSNSSAAYFSCSTYSGLAQNEVEYEFQQAVSSDNSSMTSNCSTGTCLLQQTSTVETNEGPTSESLESLKSSEEQTNNSKKQSIIDQRTLAGTEAIKKEESKKTPIRAKRKKRSKKHELDFLNVMLKSKRQKALVQEYKHMHALLMKLVKEQQNAPLKNKKERLRRQNLIKKIRNLFSILRKNLRKRDRLQRILLRKRLHRERQMKAHLRLKKIMRVVYFKRKQRIRNMRDLYSNERKRLADNLMLQAAQLRARANRLTGGREVKYTQRKVKKTNNIREATKEQKIVPPKATTVAEEENVKNSQINIKISMQQVSDSIVKTQKKPKQSKKRKRKCIDKHVKKTKAVDDKLNLLNGLMKNLLTKLSTVSKNNKNKKHKPKSSKKCTLAWWRKDRLKAAKIRAL